MEYRDVELPQGWRYIVQDRMTLGEIFNRFYALYPHEPWYGLIGDDVIPRTKDFDLELIAAAGDDGLAYCDDLLNGVEHAAHPVMGGGFVRNLGFIALPGLDKLYIDDVLFTTAVKRGKAAYVSDAVLEHMHFSNGKAPRDQTYQKAHAARDGEVFRAWSRSFV
jgi:hypothetical protein